MRMVRLVAGLPIRLRLTLVFAAVMGVVLAVMALVLYLRLGVALDATVDQSLRGRADGLAGLVRRDRSGLSEAASYRLAEPDESLAQVLQPSGAVADSTPLLDGRPLLTDAQLARAAEQTIVVERGPVPGSDNPLRLLATPVDAPAGRLVVVVGASVEERAEVLESLLAQLLIGGPAVLVLSSLAGYALAAAALRPVDSMRQEADAVSATEPGRRLPLPPANDEIARLGTTLNTMLGRLESALARERRFVADASHELRTPLAALRTELELALRRERTPQELHAAVRSAAEETERLWQLAEDLLVLVRSDTGKLPVRPERLPALELLADVRERYARRAVEAGRPLQVQADDRLELAVDRLRVEQALGNLIDNALRHGSGRILVHAQRQHDRVELHVVDEGPGFLPEFLPHAFEPFSQGDPARTGAGAGLGLAIVDVIARAHGGAAHAINGDRGPDAWIELPSIPDRLDQQPAPAPDEPTAPLRPVSRSV
jgi:signal transduction histidine kinase